MVIKGVYCKVDFIKIYYATVWRNCILVLFFKILNTDERAIKKNENILAVVEKVIGRLSVRETILPKTDLVSYEESVFKDSLNGGFKKGDLYLICGTMAIGKTAVLVNMAVDLAIKKSPNFNVVGVITLDITPEKWMQRIIANVGDISLAHISNGILRVDELEKISTSSFINSLSRIYFNDTCCMDFLATENLIKKWVLHDKMEIIFIDGIEFIQSKKDDVATKNLADWTRKLKEIASALNIPIVLSISIEENNKNPSISSKPLRNCGALEENVDVIILMLRPKFFQSCKGEIHFTMLKNNNGSLYFLKLKALMLYQRFEKIIDDEVSGKI